MPYRKVQFAQGQFYPIYRRGVGQHPIFREEENDWFLLRQVQKYANAFDITVVVYYVLPEHQHPLYFSIPKVASVASLSSTTCSRTQPITPLQHA